MKEEKNRQIRRITEYFDYEVMVHKRISLRNYYLRNFRERGWRNITNLTN